MTDAEASRGHPQSDMGLSEPYGSDILFGRKQVCAVFGLTSPGGERQWCAAAHRVLDVAAMTRHAIYLAAMRTGLETEMIDQIMGHGGSDRILIHPLPSLCDRHADGRIRRVMITAPMTLPSSAWQAAVYGLDGADLTPQGGLEPVAALSAGSFDERLVEPFVAESTDWISATPVVVPGRYTRRGKPRPQRALRELLRHAGIDEALVESFRFEPGPLLPGSQMARAYRVPQHLQGRYTSHLSVRWRVALKGPVSLGAGRGYGLGVLASLY